MLDPTTGLAESTGGMTDATTSERPDDVLRSLARRWAHAAGPNGLAGVDADRVLDHLNDLLTRLRAAAGSTPVDAATARDIGARLAGGPLGHLRSVLDDSIPFLADAAPGDIDRRRWTTATAHAVAGFVSAVEDRDGQVRPEHADRRRGRDPVTGLLSGAAFEEHMTARLASADGAHVGVLVVDVDGGDEDTGRHGVAADDELLAAVAGRLRSIAGVGGHTVGRLTGNDFALGGGLCTESADALAERVIGSLTMPFALSSGPAMIDAHVGIVTTTSCGFRSGAQLVTHAYQALGEAKDAGGSRYASRQAELATEHDHPRPDVMRRLTTARALRTAATDGSLALHYQPIVAPATGEVAAFEALLRWCHLGVLRDPAYFIDVAESSALIVEIGNWVIERAIADLADLIAAAPDSTVAVSVNVSPRQLLAPRLADVVAAALAEYDVPPSRLWIELTETGLITDTDRTEQTLTALDGLGVRVCLDDFGTGYSALSNLSNFPIGVVKIDRTFIAAADAPDTTSGRRRHDVVASIQAMADTLGVATVAEGVESDAAHLRVLELGCDYAQGWRYGRPTPAAVAFSGIVAGAAVGLRG